MRLLGRFSTVQACGMGQLYQEETYASLGVKRRMETSKVLGMHEQKLHQQRGAVRIGFIQTVKSQADA